MKTHAREVSRPTTRSRCFYALALLGTARPGDKSIAQRDAGGGDRAGHLPAQPEASRRGALHHPLVRRSRPRDPRLPAARAYSKIAPSAAHALHMPSHIFVQLGMWDDVIASNIVAYKAAVDLAAAQEPAARPRGLPHAVVAPVRATCRQASSTRRRRCVDQAKAVADKDAEPAGSRRLRGDESAPGGRDARNGRSSRCRPAPCRTAARPATTAARRMCSRPA